MSTLTGTDAPVRGDGDIDDMIYGDEDDMVSSR
jgi:hypothetical protein